MQQQKPLTQDLLSAGSNDNDRVLLSDIQFTLSQLKIDIQEAKEFLVHLFSESVLTTEKGLTLTTQPSWGPRLVRRNGIAGAVIEKAGSRNFVKRRPEDETAFQAYVQKQTDAKQPLLFRVGFGPLKNVNNCGCRQSPDWAEYLAVIQLTRMLHALAGVYPYGIKAQIVPDDLRSRSANHCPEIYIEQYIAGLQDLVARMGLWNMISVERGQAKLYAQYDVPSYREAALQALKAWQKKDPEAFAARFETAMENARKNLLCTDELTQEDIEISAWNYLIAHRAEMLSGLWSPGDAFPLRYANHPNSYQIYTIGLKKTKLPWQIELPVSLIYPEAKTA